MPTVNKIDPVELGRIVLLIISEHIGIEHRVYRKDLIAKVAVKMGKDLLTQGQWDYFDRKVRKAIETLRTESDQGAWICSTQDLDGGYYMAATDAELNDHLAVEEARGITILASVRSRRKRVGMENSDQMRLDLPEKAELLVS